MENQALLMTKPTPPLLRWDAGVRDRLDPRIRDGAEWHCRGVAAGPFLRPQVEGRSPSGFDARETAS